MMSLVAPLDQGSPPHKGTSATSSESHVIQLEVMSCRRSQWVRAPEGKYGPFHRIKVNLHPRPHHFLSEKLRIPQSYSAPASWSDFLCRRPSRAHTRWSSHFHKRTLFMCILTSHCTRYCRLADDSKRGTLGSLAPLSSKGRRNHMVSLKIQQDGQIAGRVWCGLTHPIAGEIMEVCLHVATRLCQSSWNVGCWATSMLEYRGGERCA